MRRMATRLPLETFVRNDSRSDRDVEGGGRRGAWLRISHLSGSGHPVAKVASPRLRRPPSARSVDSSPSKGLPSCSRRRLYCARRLPELQIELAGSGTCEPRLRSLAAQLGIADSVNFLGWREDVDALHRRWQVFVQPSIHEGSGSSALEAMASGLPVVASAAGGLPEVVEDGRTGFLVPVGAVDALVDRLGRLLEDEELRAEMGDAGRETRPRAFQRGRDGREESLGSTTGCSTDRRDRLSAALARAGECEPAARSSGLHPSRARRSRSSAVSLL